MNDLPLVSVAIPAYKAGFFEAALCSALNQTWRPLQIVICDDSRDDVIERLVEHHRQRTDVPIVYQRNPQGLGELFNTVEVIRLATGTYLKLLHDDDELHPECVSRQVRAMEANPQAAMVSSRRLRIDDQGRPVADILQTAFPFIGDALVDGSELVAFLGEHTLNLIGEPSCILCRREDVLAFGRGLMAVNKREISWVGDLSIYVKLLMQGPLVFLAQPLCKVRVWEGQGSQAGIDAVGIGDKGHADLRLAIAELGWCPPVEGPRLVSVALLERPADVHKVDLLAAMLAAFAKRQTAFTLNQWAALRTPSRVQQRLANEHLAARGGGPAIELLVFESAADQAARGRTAASLERLRRHYANVRLVWVEDAAQCNRAIAASRADWLMLAQAGDELTDAGLFVAALELLPDPDCRAVYGDGLWRSDEGDLTINLRPDFNLDYLLSFPDAMVQHWLFRRQSLVDAGGVDERFAGALVLELILRLIEQGGMAGFGHIHEPLMISAAPSFADTPVQRDVIARHLGLRGYSQAQVKPAAGGVYQIDYGHAEQPLVSVLLVIHDELAALQRCVMSLLEKTLYPRYELVIVDNGSRQAATRNWLDSVGRLAPERIRVLRPASVLTRSAACNLAAGQARGEYLLWLRPHVAMIDAGWMDELLNHGLRQEVAIVGAKTVSAEGVVTHAGLILGLGGAVGPAFAGVRLDAPGYMNRLQTDQNYSAVSDACLLVRASVFHEVGGFDERAFAQQGADVDLCLRVAALGYLTVWAARALLLHGQEPPSLPPAVQQATYQRWLPQLARDPAYNLNLTLHNTQSFDLVDSRISWRPLSWRPLPVVMAHPADPFGAGHYRIIQPFNGLRDNARIEGSLCDALLHPADLERYTPDAIIMQRPVTEEHLLLMRDMKAYSRAFKVFELDDYLPNLPLKSVHRGNFPKDVLRSIRRGLDCVDRFIVSTEPLAQAFKGHHADIRVVPNRLDPQWWGDLPSLPVREGGKPRVGWIGAHGHEGDLAIILDVVKALADEVDWVFFGGAPEYLRPYAKEMHPGVDIDRYPGRMARLDLDLAVAPLEHNLFNECKSNLRLLEYGICGYPVVCSDIAPYGGELPVTLVKNRYKDWLDAIRLHLSDLAATREQGARLQAAVRRDWMLDERALEQWRGAWLGER
jgi:GT2 family glycosyltransferase/glycosyltransferase involved in cell wall biosynthesis